MEKLTPNEKINIEEILKDLESYRPKRRGWTWRKSAKIGRASCRERV